MAGRGRLAQRMHVRARAVLVSASMARMDGERLGNLTEVPEGLVFPFPVSRGMANSPEELRWRQ